MKKTTFLTMLLCAALLTVGCDTVPRNDVDALGGETVAETEHVGETEETAETDGYETSSPETERYTLPTDFVFPITDGSTSTTNLDNAVRRAILGGEQKNPHTKTYTSFSNLLNGKCALIFTTPLSKGQLETMDSLGFRHEAEPVAGEGFVFVVNRDNPVDTLTIEQIKGIYSGEITNWSELGGNDAPIIAYQRNADSGSQNYMISFMGDTPLMEPITDTTPATMSGILDVIAHYDNGIDAIGYSVYAYSDGMYEDIAEIKYIKVNGVEPSLATLADGSYPLLGYNYAVFSADEQEDSHVRALVKWIQSDEGQRVIADAGYIPYRRVEGLTLPEPEVRTLYTAEATSGIPKPEEMADYYFSCVSHPKDFTAEGLNEAIQAFITQAEAELSAIDGETLDAFTQSRGEYIYPPDIVTEKYLTNGYLSVAVGIRYYYGYQDSPAYYYDARTAVFDIYTGERLTLSDLFFDGVDFVPLLNKHLADEAAEPYSGFGATYDMLREFTGLYEEEFTFTANAIIFKPGTCFKEGVSLSLGDLAEYMVTSVPRDMAGCFEAEIPVYKQIRLYHRGEIATGVEKEGISVWYLNEDKSSLSAAVCEKINAFIDDIYETYFTPEKLLAMVKDAGMEADRVQVGPFADFTVELVGDRYVDFTGANSAWVNGPDPYSFTVFEGHYNPYNFAFFFNAKTGEALKIGDLFSEGWEEQAEYYVYDDSFKVWDEMTWTPYPSPLDTASCRIMAILYYDRALFKRMDHSDLEWPVLVIAEAENGDKVVIAVPREWIK